ncbi:hypothetical protein DN069_19405 [Streptacidiphilus pinicola]|uniref:Uncharacterized protein n=1 Tax=Streptacidiphilus pinicola TaxID=2219663 RepID=A0A2X0K8V5_9ACTN|nr:hypothetical protein [Streptacidiphilus pinicola]RAG83929.1 hypothetical protein DN069_19405 [Streptacidiphilus pinicola]
MDPTGLAGLSTVAAGEGIKFLYQQVDELLQRHRAKKDRERRPTPPIVAEPSVLPPPDPAMVKVCEPALRELAEILRKPDILRSPHALEAAEELRRLLAAVYGTPIAFRDEPSAPVRVVMTVDEVAGLVTGVRTRIAAGRFDIDMKVKRVKRTGTVIGYDDSAS